MSIKNKFPNIKPSLNLDFANTKRLDPRITFTRASTATYWDGVTQAKAEENLLKYSQDFDNAAWVHLNVTITANAATAPDGTMTADAMVETATDTRHRTRQATAGGACTVSVYVKPNGTNFFAIAIDDAAAQYAVFDLVAGTVGNKVGTTGETIQAVANGFFRISVTFTTMATSGPYFHLRNANSAPAAYVGDPAKGVYIWGAQFEQRSQATAYTPTTDKPITKYQPVLQTAASEAPRFDHNPVTGESLGLLIEEQRTNLFTYGQGFDNAAWTKTDATVVSGAAVAPDGAATAFKLIPNAVSTAYHRISQAYSAANNTGYTFSIYAKAAEYSLLLISSGGSGLSGAGGSGADQTAVVDLATGSILNNKYGVKTVHVGNGWYRCAISVTTDGDGGGIGPYVGVANSATPSAYTGDGYSGIYIWGAQLEAGTFPTSYIPTTSAQVTRAADAASMTGTNFSSWYRQDEGTLFAETRRIGTAQTADEGAGVELTSGETQKNLIQLMYDNGSYNRVSVRVFLASGSYNFAGPANSPNFTAGEAARKFAAAVMSGGTALASNGSIGAPYSEAFTLPSVTMLSIKSTSYGTQGSDFNGYIKKIAYYPKRLPDATLQALTA